MDQNKDRSEIYTVDLSYNEEGEVTQGFLEHPNNSQIDIHCWNSMKTITIREHNIKMDKLQRGLSKLLRDNEAKHSSETAVLEQRIELL